MVSDYCTCCVSQPRTTDKLFDNNNTAPPSMIEKYQPEYFNFFLGVTVARPLLLLSLLLLSIFVFDFFLHLSRSKAVNRKFFTTFMVKRSEHTVYSQLSWALGDTVAMKPMQKNLRLSHNLYVSTNQKPYHERKQRTNIHNNSKLTSYFMSKLDFI